MRLNYFARCAIVFAMVLPLAGCSSNNKGKIEGTTWIVTGGSNKDASTMAAINMEINFGTDGRFAFNVLGQSLGGTYKLSSGDNVNFVFDKEPSPGKSKNARSKVVINGDAMTVTDPDGTTMTFKRKVTAPAQNKAPAPEGEKH